MISDRLLRLLGGVGVTGILVIDWIPYEQNKMMVKFMVCKAGQIDKQLETTPTPTISYNYFWRRAQWIFL